MDFSAVLFGFQPIVATLEPYPLSAGLTLTIVPVLSVTRTPRFQVLRGQLSIAPLAGLA